LSHCVRFRNVTTLNVYQSGRRFSMPRLTRKDNQDSARARRYVLTFHVARMKNESGEG
jgi:hypothetical protein